MALLSSTGKTTALAPPLPINNVIFNQLRLYLRQKQFTILAAAPSVGKAAWCGTPVATPDGWIEIGNLRPGDEVFDEQGEVARVTGVSPRWLTETFRVSFADGSEVLVNGEHEWNVLDRTRRKSHQSVTDWRDEWDRTEVMETREMFKSGLRDKFGASRFSVPTAKPLRLTEGFLRVDPYALGVWLGDGSSNSGTIFINDTTKAAIPAALEASGYVLSKQKARPNTFTIRKLKGKLAEIGVLEDKHIPVDYLRASESQRLSLLQGLMDTDGFRVNGNLFGIDLCNQELAENVVELIHSLGWKARIKEEPAGYTKNGVRHDTGLRWRINFRPTFDVFRARDERITQDVRRLSRYTHRVITDIEIVDTVETVCIEVDSPSHLFLLGKQMIPTHNSVFARNLVVRTAVPSLFFSADSDEYTVKTSVAACLTGTPLVDVEKHLEEGGAWEEYYADVFRKADHVEWVFNSDISIDFIVDKMSAYSEIYGEYPQLVVIDNIGDMTTTTGTEKYAELQEICRELRGMARSTRAHVFGLHHLTGEYEDGIKPVTLKALEGKLGRVPESVLGLNWADSAQQRVVMTVPKARGTKRGMTVPIMMDYSRALVGDFR